MNRAFLLLFGIVILIGCSTQAVPPSEAIYAPKDRVFKYQEVATNGASITIIRDSGIVGSGCYASVFIDGERVARLDTREKADFNLKSGEFIVGATIDGNGLCSFGMERQEREITLSSGDKKYFRIFTDERGNIDIKPTTLK